MRGFISLITMALLLFACSPEEPEPKSIPADLFATPIDGSEESMIATEQARAAAIQTEGALTRAAQPSFTPPPTLTPTSANLATLTPIPNSTQAGIGAFMDVPPDVLGPNYEIQNAYYFDRSDGRERYEVYAGAIAGYRDADSAQGVVVVRVLQVTEKDAIPSVEVVATHEFLTTDEHYDVFPAGPVQINTNLAPESEEGGFVLVSTSQGFSWIFVPTEPYLNINSVPPAARLEIGEQMQIARVGGYCWLRSCADGGWISTSPTPLTLQSNVHLHLPLAEPPDNLSFSAMLVSPPGILQYDSLFEDRAEWTYEKPGRETLELDELRLQREQDIQLSLEPGYYVLTVFAAWEDYGDATFAFLIEVQK